MCLKFVEFCIGECVLKSTDFISKLSTLYKNQNSIFPGSSYNTIHEVYYYFLNWKGATQLLDKETKQSQITGLESLDLSSGSRREPVI